MTHARVYVLDQNLARDFYINKLGFQLIADEPMPGGDRWITVGPPQEPRFEIILAPITRGIDSPEIVDTLRKLLERGTFGVGIFTCNDVQATYEELKAKGVKFTKIPTREPWGTEAIFKDNSGNWFSLAKLG